MDPLILRQPVAHLFVLVSCIIVNDDVQLLVFLGLTFYLFKKPQKLLVGVFLIALTNNATGCHLKCCKQRTGAISLIVMRYRTTTSLLQWQTRR